MLCTPVLIAAAFNRVDAFRCLLSFMDLKNAEKNPIFKALHVKMYRADILNVSLPTHTYIFACSLYMYNYILYAIMYLFQQFLIMDTEYGTSLCKSTDSHKNSVFHVTARENDLEAMAVLMKHGMRSYVKNMDGKTPMHLAAEEGHHE